MYEERPSRFAGGFVWRSVPEAGEARVLPDGCMDIVWSDGRLFVAGPDTRAHVFTRPDRAPVFGLRFAPGAGPAVLGAPAHEFTDAQVPLDAVWPAREARILAERLAEARDPGTLLESAAWARHPTDLASDKLVEGIVARARRGDRVASVADAVGLSERHLHRRCHEAFGYGAKTLVRILRLSRALELARAGVPPADAASRCGYADQAHLSRDVKDLAGVPLGRLLPAPARGPGPT